MISEELASGYTMSTSPSSDMFRAARCIACAVALAVLLPQAAAQQRADWAQTAPIFAVAPAL
jgi:hypothetical protein